MSVKLDVEIEKVFRGILEEVGYKVDGCWNIEKNNEVKERLGKLWFDYVIAMFDGEFEGYNSKDKRGILNMFKDMEVYLKEK